MRWQWSWQLCLNDYVLEKNMLNWQPWKHKHHCSRNRYSIKCSCTSFSYCVPLDSLVLTDEKAIKSVSFVHGWEQGMCWVPIKTGIRFVLFYFIFFKASIIIILSQQWNLWTEILLFLKVSLNQRMFLSPRKFKILLLMGWGRIQGNWSHPFKLA